MPRDFSYLLHKHGKEGARQVFEDVCADVFKKEHENSFQIKCDPGDDGIDVFVGDFSDPIDVYQCKCFFDEIGTSQINQIKKSFKKAIESKNYKLKSWTLCVPKTLTIDEMKWWSKWKKEKENLHRIEVELMDSTSLLLLITKHDLHLDIFDEEVLEKLDEILDEIRDRKQVLKEILDTPEDIDFSERVFSLKLKSAGIDDHEDIYNKQFFNAEILKNEIRSKGIDRELKELKSLEASLHELWLTQFLKYKSNADGNELLGTVFEKIEEYHEASLLNTTIDVSPTEKKGILHQLADECKVGWVKDYKQKIKEFKSREDG